MSHLRISLFLLVCAAVLASACHGSQSPRRTGGSKTELMKEMKNEMKEDKKEETKEKPDAATLAEYETFKSLLVKEQKDITNLMTLKEKTMVDDDAEIEKFLQIAKDKGDTVVSERIEAAKKA